MKIKECGILRGLIIAALVSVTSSKVTAQDVTHLSADTVAHAVLRQPGPNIPANDSRESTEEFFQLVEQIEADHGPFDYRLSEPLQTAGDVLEMRGDYLQALRLYDRALHVIRINSGLYSEDQIAIVERLINVNVALENWQVVDNHFRYLHLLYTRLYKDNIPALNRGLAQISDWHVLAINNDFGTDRVDHLREANKLFNQRLAMTEGSVADDDPAIHTLRYNIAVTQYHLRVLSGGGSNDSIFNRLEERYEEQLAALD